MFNLDTYYQQAWSGETVDNDEVLKFIKSFKSVILWGASYLGKAIGTKLLQEGIEIERYWDLRAEELKEVNGVKVTQPFSGKEEGTLVIFCIGNNVILKRLIVICEDKGYINIIRGDYLYMGLLCPFTNHTGINAKRCSTTMECRQVYCKRLANIIKTNVPEANPEEAIHLTSVTLVINQRCSLKCKYCTSYMNEYDVKERIDFPLSRICEDIDVFFNTVDTVGTITVMGGEPFMHPHIGKIIKHLCSKKNFGLISIATSGTYPITPEQLISLKDKRVNISFSNYTETIKEKQSEMYYNNIELVKNSGVCYTVGLFSPEWIVPSKLYKVNRTEEEMIAQRKKCIQWHQIKNGKIHPCDFATALYSLKIADYSTDYVDLTEDLPKDQMKKKIKEYIERPYYQSCGHHALNKKMTAKAAEQGYMDFKYPEIGDEEMAGE